MPMSQLTTLLGENFPPHLRGITRGMEIEEVKQIEKADLQEEEENPTSLYYYDELEYEDSVEIYYLFDDGKKLSGWEFFYHYLLNSPDMDGSAFFQLLEQLVALVNNQMDTAKIEQTNSESEHQYTWKSHDDAGISMELILRNYFQEDPEDSTYDKHVLKMTYEPLSH